MYDMNVERVGLTRHHDQRFINFDVNVHREKYDKAAVSWNYPSYHQQPDKWQVTMQEFLYMI